MSDGRQLCVRVMHDHIDLLDGYGCGNKSRGLFRIIEENREKMEKATNEWTERKKTIYGDNLTPKLSTTEKSDS